MQKRYTDPHPTREPRSNKVVPMEEFRQDMEGYRPELQYSQLQPRGIDPDVILRNANARAPASARTPKGALVHERQWQGVREQQDVWELQA